MDRGSGREYSVLIERTMSRKLITEKFKNMLSDKESVSARPSLYRVVCDADCSAYLPVGGV